ncbi:Chromatin structure-remodeling complex subunit RSC1 [Cladobotryum mycophilum]|uniref:Chromatin structure-remodeling complex subunit RSC1 n=1 Tax=Cladobotryum mycophilum TaxID=491253 RepID=A0ABR0SMW7_9HYPO
MADDGSIQEARKSEMDEDVDMKDSPDEDESDADGEENEEGSHDMFEMIHNLSKYLCSVEEDGEELAAGFQRIPNRRILPDYFDIIDEPVAFSTIRGKTQKKQYAAFPEFVKDVAQICHNAQVYNRPSAPIFGAAERLRQIFQEELQKTTPAEESPSRDSEVEDVEEEEEEEEEDEDEDDDDEEDEESEDEGGRRHRRRGRGRFAASGRKDRDGENDEESHKKRGRPPMVLTPMEARISSIIKGLRKVKDKDGRMLILPFEKLPDKSAVPDYYQTIANPIALDNIKKKAKRKKYRSVDQVMLDIELMFENAKLYNEDDSEVYRAAVDLQQQARILAEQEKVKPDDDFRDEDGKLPLAEIHYSGDTWRVGDWVHIRNPNDLAKPIVAQIFRTWQDRAGQKWINACWYYRPEQTVHRYQKHFFEHEVVKTGQYRDHQIGEVIDRCFVMFVTRFNKGRPRGFPPEKDVYVCESRYNEERFRFNKIKTWASCVPDEVRDKDYEMDLFEVPRRMRKVPSPIKHLLREDAKETDQLPRPTWGSPNAPPIVGAVHRRPPEPNESPPPEPTAPPPPASMASEIPPTLCIEGLLYTKHQFLFLILLSKRPNPKFPCGQCNINTNIRNLAILKAMHPTIPNHRLYRCIISPGLIPGQETTTRDLSPQLRDLLPPEVYTLPENINDALPAEVRQSFQRDTTGKVLFFTTPPLDRPTHGLSPASAGLGHSIKYLAGREAWLAEREKKRKERGDTAKNSSGEADNGDETSHGLPADAVASKAVQAVEEWTQHLDEETERWEKDAGLEGWRNSVKRRNVL